MRISDWSSDVCSSDLYEADKKPRLNTLGASMRPDITGQFIETNFPTNSLRLQFLVGSVIEQRRYLKRMRERYKLIFYASQSVLIITSTATGGFGRSEEHTSELQSLMRTSYAVFCLKKTK